MSTAHTNSVSTCTQTKTRKQKKKEFARELEALLIGKQLQAASRRQCFRLDHKLFPWPAKRGRAFQKSRVHFIKEAVEENLSTIIDVDNSGFFKNAIDVYRLQVVLSWNHGVMPDEKDIDDAAKQIVRQQSALDNRKGTSVWMTRDLSGRLKIQDNGSLGLNRALWNSEMFRYLEEIEPKVVDSWQRCPRPKDLTAADKAYQKSVRTISTQGFTVTSYDGSKVVYFVAGFQTIAEAHHVRDQIAQHYDWCEKIPDRDVVRCRLIAPDLEKREDASLDGTSETQPPRYNPITGEVEQPTSDE